MCVENDKIINKKRVKFLESEELFLTPLIIEDFEKYYKWFNDIEFLYMVGSPVRPSVYLKGKKDFESLINSCDGNKRIFLSIISKESFKYIGNVGLDGIDNYSRKCSFGIFIGEKEFRNKGYANTASRLIIDYGLNNLGLFRISSSTHAKNTISQKLLEKIGFIKEGVKRKDVFLNGEYLDSIIYGLLKEEFSL